MTAWRDDPEHLRMQQKFQATGDLRFAALAIGRWHAYGRPPESAPLWALDACTAAFDRAATEIAPVIAKTQGSGPTPTDYSVVQWVADQRFAGNERPVRKLLRDWLRLTGCKQEETNLRRLLNYFTGRNGGPTTEHHIDQAAKRMARSRGVKELGDL